jgi:hypothetical protein
MTSHRITLDALPDSLQIRILKYLSIYDCYHSVFPLNRRYAKLVKCRTPDKVNTEGLDQETNRSGVLISDYWVWNDRFVYWMVPRLQLNTVQWIFLPIDSIERYKQTLDPRIIDILARYQVQSDAPGLLVSQPNYYFCSLPDGLPRLENWIRENYPAQYEVVTNYGARQHLPKRINHHDGQYMEIKQALAEVQRLERLKRRDIIHQCAQLIWTTAKALDDLNLLDFDNGGYI